MKARSLSLDMIGQNPVVRVRTRPARIFPRERDSENFSIIVRNPAYAGDEKQMD